MSGSAISFFQRYSQPENHVTNNTALLLRHIYQASPEKLQSILSQLVDDILDVGPTFRQQPRGKASVPDASIIQPGWRIIIETKLTPNLDEDQIIRHFDTGRAAEGEAIYVIALTTETDRQIAAKLAALAKERRIAFAWRSFAELGEIVDGACAVHETSMREIIADYIDFLSSENLLDTPHDRIYVVPCGTSYDDNIKFGLYYHPAERSYRPSKYLGVYRQRCVSAVGEVEAVAVCDYADGQLNCVVERGTLTEQHKLQIRRAIEQTKYYDLSRDTRFFVTGGFASTRIQKATPRGIWGARYLSIAELTGKRPAADARLLEVAEGLLDRRFD
jgi:hypothetical protein